MMLCGGERVGTSGEGGMWIGLESFISKGDGEIQAHFEWSEWKILSIMQWKRNQPLSCHPLVYRGTCMCCFPEVTFPNIIIILNFCWSEGWKMNILSLIFPCEVEHIFINLLAIYISSFMSCLFMIFSYFSIDSVLFLLIYRNIDT